MPSSGLRRRRTAAPPHWRRHLLAAALGAAGMAQAAPFAARVTEADPPTGETPLPDASAEEPLAAGGSGIRWTLAPWRHQGTLTLDGRWLRAESGRRSTQLLLIGDVDFSSYVWQPWFLQLRGGLGLLVDRSRSSGLDGDGAGRGSGLTLRAGASLFPASRFPFDAHLDVGDTRSSGQTLVTDYRTLRLGISQSWRPVDGSDQWQFNFDHSRLNGTGGLSDRLSALRASGVMQRDEHLFDVGASWSVNSRTDTGDRSTQALLTARHGWQDDHGLVVDTLASWNDLRVRVGGGGTPLRLDTRLMQVSTLVSWRPAPGQWLYDEQAPAVMTGTLRVVGTGQDSGSGRSDGRSYGATLGVSKEFSRAWRASLGLGLTRQDTSFGTSRQQSTLNSVLLYTPSSVALGTWRWVPTASVNLGLSQSSDDGARRLLGVQAGHALSRGWVPAQGQTLSLSLSQNLGWLSQSASAQRATGLAHGLGLAWQGGSSSAQTLASLTLSDSRTRAELDSRYQFVNLQLSRRSQLTRYSSWSASLTLQATRSDAESLDAFTGERRSQGDGWLHYTSGSLSYESQRVFDVPRLRFTALLTVNSQQIERRASGDFDAPLERVTESAELRLDWNVGRLDTRLAARWARVDGRTVAALSARAMRRF